MGDEKQISNLKKIQKVCEYFGHSLEMKSEKKSAFWVNQYSLPQML